VIVLIEDVIVDYLTNYAALKAVHGGRCRQGLAKQGWPTPHQTVFLISDPPEMKRLGIPSPRIQINNFSTKYGEARLMGELTYEALDGFSGTLGGVKVEHGSYEDLNPVYEPETKLWNCQIDFKTIYRR
jgi:hypothetical protein